MLLIGKLQFAHAHIHIDTHINTHARTHTSQHSLAIFIGNDFD